MIHGLVCYRDGSLLAQLGSPDMRIPIAHTLAWPERMATRSPRLDLAALARLDFAEPDSVRFPALRPRVDAAALAGLDGLTLDAALARLDERLRVMDGGVAAFPLNRLRRAPAISSSFRRPQECQ